jgi:hypothetical protein
MWIPTRLRPAADSDPQAFDLAIAWAASLGLAADDEVVLAIKLPSGALRVTLRRGPRLRGGAGAAVGHPVPR